MALTKLTTDLIDGTIVTSVNGSTGAVTLETGTDWQATLKTADFPAVAGEGYFVNTTSAAITVTLPGSPTAGDEVSIVDYAGTAATNNITITSTDNINGASNDVLINYERGGVSMVYVDATQGWIAYNAANETATALPSALPPLTVDYLVVAGGGSGGANEGGGGGAGGLRTSYTNSSSLSGHIESSLTLSTGSDYSVTIGAGGSSISITGAGDNGSNSIFSTITSTGGGGGGYWTDNNGLSGGSGGGGGAHTGTGGAAVTSPVVQGYSGGDGGSSSTNYAGAGGGGAGAIGQDSTTSDCGDGGAGLEVNIIGGTGNYYAGGGGGGTTASATFGAGGSGGGGNGGNNSSTLPTNGAPNSGGGGGGNGNGAGGTGVGGSGVVILRYPNTFTVTIGSGLTGSTATNGSDKVTTFTGGTGTISFS